jgi:membrane protein YqaA with SNARE-associated domain
MRVTKTSNPEPVVPNAMLKRAYDWCVSYASHPGAPWLLFGLTFIESSFSPLPPIPLLLPMCIARPPRI